MASAALHVVDANRNGTYSNVQGGVLINAIDSADPYYLLNPKLTVSTILN